MVKYSLFIKRIISCLLTLFLSISCLVSTALAIDVSPGDQLELKATNRLGVPLHQTSSSSLVGRTPDGTIVSILETADNGQWINIKLPEGQERWIVERYIKKVNPSQDDDSGELDQEQDNLEQDDSIEAIFPDLTGEELRSRLAAEFQVQNSLGYRRAREYMYTQLDNENGIVRGIYSDFEQPIDPNASEPTQEAYQNGKGINAEHSWPQSRGATGIAKSDIHHLFPSHVRVNQRRGNSPFAEIPDDQTNLWLIRNEEKSTIPTSNIDEYSEATNSAFEPREAVKGDIARAQFYFYTIYRNQADKDFFNQQRNTLCQWHTNDPVNEAELARSHGIAQKQGNENPFVLDPSLAKRLYCR